MIKTVNYKGELYPEFQTKGNASQFAIPYAKHVCEGEGVDVGCMKPEWAFPGAHMVDPAINEHHALSFPWENLDYIFSSHCLEHVYDWVEVLEYWTGKLKSGGTVFLYLPDYSQVYWRPWNNRKHLNIFTPQIIEDYMKDAGYTNVFASQVDLNNAFMVMGQKL